MELLAIRLGLNGVTAVAVNMREQFGRDIFLRSIQLLREARLSGTPAFSAIIERTAETDLPLWRISAATSIP